MKVIITSVFLICLIISPIAGAQTRSVALQNSQFGPVIVTASSTLTPQAGNSYAPGNVLDGNDSTAWVEGAKGVGVGEAIVITFEQPIRVGTLYIKNGYGKNADVFKKNARIKDANIQASGGLYKIQLKDTIGEQVIRLPSNISSVPTDFVKLTIESVYPGTQWQDTALNEFRPDFEEFNYQ